MRLPDRSSGSASPRFSRQRRRRAASSLPMMIRASEPPIKLRYLGIRSIRLQCGFSSSVEIVHRTEIVTLLDTIKSFIATEIVTML